MFCWPLPFDKWAEIVSFGDFWKFLSTSNRATLLYKLPTIIAEHATYGSLQLWAPKLNDVTGLDLSAPSMTT